MCLWGEHVGKRAHHNWMMMMMANMCAIITGVCADSKSKDDLALWNWFLVFVGVTLPSLAMTPQSNFISVIEGVYS